MERTEHFFTFADGSIEFFGIPLSLSPEQFEGRLLERGFTRDADGLVGHIKGLGACSVVLYGTSTVGTVTVMTECRFSEKEMMEVFRQVDAELPGEPLYDDGGYGMSPAPHQIRHFWDFDQGYVRFDWDGYKYDNLADEPGPQGDGYDRIVLHVRPPLLKDEEYWRSEVD